tara:strand:+ start:1126 stop:2253 length:1128 start_codon:yes stop_codon:yes gene_type:complete
MFLAGRGWGKTLTGAMDMITYCLKKPNVMCGVVAPTYSDLSKVCFQGESGIISIIDKDLLAYKGYNKSASEITFHNGSKIIGFPAIEADRIRGQNFHRVWCDEVASWRYRETFDNLMMALRLGENPKCIITTTPRPLPLIKELFERKDVKKITGSTFENEDNLAKSTISMLKDRYENTRLGRQELYAEILEDIEGSLFKRDLIDNARVKQQPQLSKIVIAVDPAVTSNANSDETGIIVVGRGEDNHYYILDDRSGTYTPDDWIKKAIGLYYEYEANYITAEVNNGGDLIERLLRVQDGQIPYRAIRSSKGKMLRAEPVSSLYEQGKVHHVGFFKDLEEQMCQYTGNSVSSPDRLDALVFGITSLQNSGKAVFRIS